MYAKRIREKKVPWGGRILAAPFPAHRTVSLVGSIVGGSRVAGSDELAKLHAEMLLEGTKKHAKKDLQILLDSLGASLAFTATDERLVFTARAPEAHVEKLTALIAEILREPAFPSRNLSILKKRELANLAMAAQETRTQANIALSRLLYPQEHPNFDETIDEARQVLESTTAQKLAALHRQIVGRRTLVIAFAGDIEPQRAWGIAEKHFKTLPNHAPQLPGFAAAALQEPKRTVVPIEHKASIDYMAGIATGITKNHPDYPALLLGLQILGNAGSFTGRLMKIVREEKGLTYSVYSYGSGFTAVLDGSVATWGTFAPQLFKEGRAAIWSELRRIAAKGATSEEVKKHRALFAARFAVRLSNSGALAQAAHDTVAEDHPLSYLDEFPRRISKLTAREVNAALKKYLIPEKLSEAAAGPVAPGDLEAL